MAERYARALAKTTTCLIDLGRFEEAEACIVDLQNMLRVDGFKRTDIQLNIQKDNTIHRLQICNCTGNFERGLELNVVCLC